MGGWMNLLPKAPAPQSASQVYDDAIKGQAQRQQMQQSAQYNQARIAEENSLAAEHQRTVDAATAISGAIASNTKFNPDGTAAINYAGAIKDVNDKGYGDHSVDILNKGAEQVKNTLGAQAEQAKTFGNAAGSSYRVPDNVWGTPDEPAHVQLAREGALRSIDQLQQSGQMDAATAQIWRAQAANYDRGFQAKLDQYASYGDTHSKHLTAAKEGVDLLTAQLTQGSKVTEAAANADKAQTAATEASEGLGARDVNAGVAPVSSNTGTPTTVSPVSIPAGAPVKTGAASPGNQPAQSSAPAPAQPGAPDYTNQYNTPLKPEERAAFQAWKQKYAPNDSGSDYDLQGAFKAGVTPDGDRGHFPDTFKKPNHPTFSDESQYSGKDGNVGGTWNKDGSFTPSKTNLQMHSATGLQNYFSQNEPDSKLNIQSKDPTWTPEKQATWDAQRADPNNKGVAKYMDPVWSQKNQDAVGKLAPALARAGGENASKTEMDQMNLWGRKLSAAARQGQVAYTQTFNGAPDNIKQLAPQPGQFDADKTPKLAAAIGETAIQQENDNKPPKATNPGGMSDTQYRMWFDKHATLQKNEQDKWIQTGEIGDILSTPNGEDFRDPKSGKTVTMDTNQRNYWQNQYEGARTQATQFNQQAKEIRSRLHGGEFESGGAPTAPARQAGTASPAGGRVTVTLPNGKPKIFPDQKSLDSFNKQYNVNLTGH